MPNQRIDQLNAETTPAAADLLPIYSIAGSDTKKITIKNLVQQGAALVDDASIPLAKVSLGGLSIANANIDASAAISYSKLAPLTSGNIVLGNSSNIAASQAVTGDVTISNTGVTAIAAGVIVDADINASAAIADTKLATISTASKVSNSATTATNSNTASAIVSRDASGNFTAGTITAALTGTASGNLVSGGALGTPSGGTLTSCTGLPISTGVSGLGTGAATFLATPSSANLAALLTDETGSGANVFATSPTLISPALGTPSSGVLTNCTNLPIAISGTAGAMSPGTGLSVTGGGVLNHTSSITAGTTSGFTYNAQGHITGAVALAGADLPISTSSVIGAVRPGTGLSVDGNGILAVTAATNAALGGVIAGSDFSVTTGTISLAAQAGIAAGQYTKVTINSKGITTAGTVLSAGDIPNIATSQITSGTLAIDRYGANTITGAKLANYSISKISDAFPTADYISQLYFSPLEKTLYMWDGNVYQPIGVSYGQVVFSGTYDAGTNLITSVTTEGAAIGLTVGGALVSPVTATKGHYVVVDQPGTGTAPAPTIALSPPDMLLSNGTTWVLLDVSDTVTAQLASNIQVSPAGNIASTNVQSALQELDDEKLAKAGGTLTGNLALNTGIAIVYEGATTDNFETTLYVVDPTADQTILLPNISGTLITTGDTGTVTSTMILDGTILNADVNASAAIAGTKISPDFGAQTIVTTGVHSAALGAAATPSITFTGDLNTGIYSPGADQVAVATNGTGRVFIDASGNVGVGTASPGYALDIASADTTAGNALRLRQNATATAAGLQFTDAGVTTQHGAIVSDASSNLKFATGNTEKLRITSAGLVGIGTNASNANGGILQLSSGITFPATAVAASDANTLDDYEEGTWTPSIGGTATYNHQNARYTKIGRMVYVSAIFGVNIIGTGSASVISGLPFGGSSGNVGTEAGLSISYFANLASNVVSLSANANVGTNIDFYGLTAAGAGVTPISPFQNGTRIDFAGWYITA